MAKILTMKGRTIEELQALSLDELKKIVPSRSRRALKRGFSPQQKKFLQKLRSSNKPVKTHIRDIIILPDFVGKRVLIYAGKEWVQVDIKMEMIGHRLGEFAQTRKRVMHSAPGVGATRSSKFLPLK